MARHLLRLCVLASWSLTASALAQASPAQAQLQGKIDRFTIAPSGTPDGFLLDSGLEVHFQRYLGKQLQSTFRRGALVRAQGTYLAAQHLLLATSAKDLVNGRRVDDKGEVGIQPLSALGGIPASTDGVVKAVLHGSRGQVDGAILDNDVTVRLPSGVPAILPALFSIGGHLAVRGQELDTENGRLIRIEGMGPSASELTAIQQTAAGGQ